MRNLKVPYHLFLENRALYFLNIFSFLKKTFKNIFSLIKKAKHSLLFKNSLLFFFLCVIPMIGVFIGDYVSDQIEMEKTHSALEKILVKRTESYAQFLYDLRSKILLEKLYTNKEKLSQLLATVHALRSYAADPFLQSMTGFQWISPSLKAIGIYGELKNFEPKIFLTFFRSLDQMPNRIQMAKINNVIYLGLGIEEHDDIKGYLLLPFPLEAIVQYSNNTEFRTFSLSSGLNLPSLGLPIDELIKKPFSYVQIFKTKQWVTYFSENAFAYSIFLLFAIIILLLKRKNDTQQIRELSQTNRTINRLKNNLQAQQKAANLIIGRLHEVNGSIAEMSTLLLETRSSSTILNEQEKLKFISKIYQVSSSLEKKIIHQTNTAVINIGEIITQSMDFYGPKIDEAQIEVKKEFEPTQLDFVSEKDTLTQLVFNLLHKALERTPEKGTMLIRIMIPEKKGEGTFILTIEDNGYPFSPEELKRFMKPHQTIFEDYFDLEWEKIITLAKNLNCHISHETLSPRGNRIVLKIHELKKSSSRKETSYEQYTSKNNIVRLFPSS